MSLHGIDIASYQAGLDPARVPCDFIIVKATQGTTYVNPDFRRAADAALSAGRLLGIYHYAAGTNQIAEADFFLKIIAPYIGKATLWLDWEGEQNSAFGRADASWCRMWLNRIREKTGISSGVYMSKSVCRAHDWSKISGDYPLWCAQYANDNPTGYQSEPWTDSKGFGAWAKPVIYQYSSHGRLDNWRGNLDMDIAYMSRDEWTAMAGGKAERPAVPFPEKTDTDLAVEVWAGIHGGEGQRRKNFGIRYDSVQAEVNRLNDLHISAFFPILLGYQDKFGQIKRA